MKNNDKIFRLLLWTGIIFVLFGSVFFITKWRQSSPSSVQFGITYSTTYAASLGLDVKQSYANIIEDLGVRFVRLPVYWSEIEQQSGVYQWSQLDDLVRYSEDNDVKLTLVVGSKVPRWPECYVPDWAEKMSVPDRQEEKMQMIQSVVNRYKKSSAVIRWQVENEPFFPFGVCEQMKKDDLIEEINLVRSLDSRPIQLTAGGEVEPWRDVAKEADILGISLYRTTWNDAFGYFEYPLSPQYYTLRTSLIADLEKKVIVSELQAEPWFSEPMKQKTQEYWYQVFSAENFKDNIQFIKESHIDEAYLWGAEWWEYLHQNSDDRLWNVAKGLF